LKRLLVTFPAISVLFHLIAFLVILICCRYVASAAGINQSDPNYEHWKGVFEHFLPKEEEQPLDVDAVDRMLASASNVPLPPSAPEEKSLSKRRKKLMSRLRCECMCSAFNFPRKSLSFPPYLLTLSVPQRR
jgi:hypothetical protein